MAGHVSVEVGALEGMNYGKECVLSSPLLVDRVAVGAAVSNSFISDQLKIAGESVVYARVTTDTACVIAFGTSPDAAATKPTEVSTAAIQLSPSYPLIMRVSPSWKFITAALV